MFTDTRSICSSHRAARAENRRAFIAQLREKGITAALIIRETPLSVVITTTDQHADSAVCHLANRAATNVTPSRTYNTATKTATITIRF